MEIFLQSSDYVEAMWLMLQQKNPDDFVIGTGQSNSIEEFANLAFSHVGLNYKDFIEIDPSLIRPAEVDTLIANYNKANKILGWNYKVSFENLVKIMVEADLKNITDQKS